MSQKQTKIDTITEDISEVAQQLGLVLMTAATMIGMMDVHDKINSKVVVPNQPAFATATDNNSDTNPLRREREEVGVHYVSYSENQRTAARSGKL